MADSEDVKAEQGVCVYQVCSITVDGDKYP